MSSRAKVVRIAEIRADPLNECAFPLEAGLELPAEIKSSSAIEIAFLVGRIVADALKRADGEFVGYVIAMDRDSVAAFDGWPRRMLLENPGRGEFERPGRGRARRGRGLRDRPRERPDAGPVGPGRLPAGHPLQDLHGQRGLRGDLRRRPGALRLAHDHPRGMTRLRAREDGGVEPPAIGHCCGEGTIERIFNPAS